MDTSKIVGNCQQLQLFLQSADFLNRPNEVKLEILRGLRDCEIAGKNRALLLTRIFGKTIKIQREMLLEEWKILGANI